MENFLDVKNLMNFLTNELQCITRLMYFYPKTIKHIVNNFWFFFLDMKIIVN